MDVDELFIIPFYQPERFNSSRDLTHPRLGPTGVYISSLTPENQLSGWQIEALRL